MYNLENFDLIRTNMDQYQSFIELLTDATHLLNDQPKDIQDLIIWACQLDDEARAALILSYRNIYANELDTK
jgi:hypothetical protein